MSVIVEWGVAGRCGSRGWVGGTDETKKNERVLVEEGREGAGGHN